jgi:hypothetical protein
MKSMSLREFLGHFVLNLCVLKFSPSLATGTIYNRVTKSSSYYERFYRYARDSRKHWLYRVLSYNIARS